jgi:putative oligomerization/nucleic acid binding protein
MQTTAATRRARVRVNPYKIFIVPLLLAAAASLGTAPATRIACGQCEEADRFVRLQTVPTHSRPVSSQGFTHPFALSPEDWKSILTELHVQRQAEGLLIPVPQGPVLSAFTEEEVSYLSVTLSKAFAQAQPNEWVVFGLTRSTPQGLTELTTGGGYVEGPSLHVVLANYRKVVTMPSTRQLLWERPLRPDAGPAYDLVAGNHQTIVRESGFVPSLLSSAPSELAIAYQALLLGEPAEASVTQKTTAATQMAIPPPTIIAPPLSIEERLQALKRLRAQGLITEEEYRAKKQQLLDQF